MIIMDESIVDLYVCYTEIKHLPLLEKNQAHTHTKTIFKAGETLETNNHWTHRDSTIFLGIIQHFHTHFH